MTVTEIRLNLAVMDSADSHTHNGLTEAAGASDQFAWRASAAALFLPALVVAAGYGALLLALVLADRGNGPLARVCMIVLVIGVPLLLAHAGLRLSTTRLALHASYLEVHPGFPARDPVTIPYASVSRATVRRGLSGWITGAGSLVIERESGLPVIVSGLSSPDTAVAKLDAYRDGVHGKRVNATVG
ncbi:hypothetical protein SAMN05877838_0952 [Hoeflea halophila]|uniref:PH (Pleckstrin Homology) domain-containing protein n=1 Tax=Hoeflea halophila TaxID=714899 RepID=A0A286I179_9HYPH|nr:hypothetical protein [Hoeflea halophila]SOE13828.1 hypothetical protein SAMN05877838_0952 [Hoeflea halophila]